MRPGQFVAVILGWSLAAKCAMAADWIVAPSYYTHDPLTGHAVTQYAEIGPYYYYHRPDYQKSGYRHYRSTIQTGNTADNMHMVEEYGRPIRPYEEWRFPYRPYSVPYDAWGPPFGGLGGGAGYGGFYGGLPFGPIGPAAGFGGRRNHAQPWLDGHYPTYDRNDRSDYYRSYP